jgi:hypothetical protein
LLTDSWMLLRDACAWVLLSDVGLFSIFMSVVECLLNVVERLILQYCWEKMLVLECCCWVSVKCCGEILACCWEMLVLECRCWASVECCWVSVFQVLKTPN